MPDLIKEMQQAIADGVQRLINADQAAKQTVLGASGRGVATGIAFGGAAGIRDDTRVTTGYDATTGLTTVGFVLDASELDGDDVWSM